MEITGKITQVFKVVTGNSARGTWSKQEFILEQPGQYPKPVCLQLWGDEQINKYDLVVGLTVTAHINLESREYNGKWFTDVRCWKLTWDTQQKRSWQPGGEKDVPRGTKGAAATEDAPRQEYKAPDLGTGPLSDDLPF